MKGTCTRGVVASVVGILACARALASFGLDLGARGEHYFAEHGVGQNEVKWFALFDARATGLWRTEWGEARLATDFTLPPRDPSLFVLTPKENYVSLGRGDGPWQLSLGQKALVFSEMDRRWELGLWGPRKRIDPLRTEPMGLLGFFAEVRAGLFRGGAYVSPLSLPELGVPSEVKNGAFRSAYPMFSAPSDEIELFGVATPVRYALEEPSRWEFLKRWNGGATVQLGDDASGPFGRASYAYQTIPQILVGFTGGLGQGGPLREARVTLYPRRADHHLAGVEAGYAWDGGRFVASASEERVIRDVTPSHWNTQEIAERTRYLSFAQDFRIWGKDTQAGWLELMGFRRIGDDEPDRGPLLTGSGNLFDPRSPYSTAVSMKLAYGAPWTSGKLSLEHRWIRDLAGLSDGWSTQGVFHATRSLRFLAGFDFLRTLRPDRTEDLLSIYRAQDRLYGGIRYAF